MKHTEFTLKTFDGLQLFGQSWQPEGQPRAVVCLVHGLGEHSGRYVQVADSLTQAGYILISFDLRGHGLLNWITNANLPAGNSKEGNINLSFTEASISEEPGGVVPHAGICAGAVG